MAGDDEQVSQAEHWDRTYARRAPDEVSWYQPTPELSLELIEGAGVTASDPVLDAGGGASTLVGALVDRGFRDVTVVDLSQRALDMVRQRLGERDDGVRLLCGDVTRLELGGPFRLWHDRAVLHFLIDAADRERYVAQLLRHVQPGGHVVLATFAEDGPERCSGLPVQRYDAERMQRTLGPELELLETRREVHRTPAGGEQRFRYGLFRRR
jgi:SAM-dependent methyltransferase